MFFLESVYIEIGSSHNDWGFYKVEELQNTDTENSQNPHVPLYPNPSTSLWIDIYSYSGLQDYWSLLDVLFSQVYIRP